jgi:hypothetical protein
MKEFLRKHPVAITGATLGVLALAVSCGSHESSSHSDSSTHGIEYADHGDSSIHINKDEPFYDDPDFTTQCGTAAKAFDMVPRREAAVDVNITFFAEDAIVLPLAPFKQRHCIGTAWVAPNS